MNDSPAVMQDFVFGTLETDANTLQAQRSQWSGIRHTHAIDPLDPLPGQPVTITVSVGRDVHIDRLAAYVTTDGSDPDGSHGRATNGFAVELELVDTIWQPLYWDYADLWRGVIPPQPNGAFVRYRIEGWHSASPSELPSPSGRAPQPGGDARVGGEGESIWSNELRIDGTTEPATLYGYSVDRFETPAWAHEAIVYQIFVDRFAPVETGWLAADEMESFHGGALRGVIDNLDFIADLGVTAIWLTPIFTTASYHAYDTVDYMEIDPRFGSKADLAELVEAAHRHGLRIILDFVANHCSDRFAPFAQALEDPASPYRQWYDFSPAYPHGYRTFFTARQMPQFNHLSPQARQYLLDAARYWLREFDVDGYRLDYAAGPGHEFWSAFGRACKEVNPDCWLFGEVTLGSDWLRSYAGRLDGCLDFSFVRQLRLLCATGGAATSIGAFAASLARARRFFPASFTRPTFIDNHDMNRFLWTAGGDKRLLRMAVGLLLACGTTPILYYGTEVGLGQPRAKGPYREEARHPMLWGDAQDVELLAYCRELISFRRSHPALARGDLETLAQDEAAGVWLTRRSWQDDQVLVAVNSGDQDQRVTLPDGVLRDTGGRRIEGDLDLPARSVVLLA